MPISLSDIRVTLKRAANVEPAGAPIPEKEDAYPDPTMFGELPAYGMFLRHAAAVTLSNVTMTAAQGEMRPGLVAQDVQSLERINVRASKPIVNGRAE